MGNAFHRRVGSVRNAKAIVDVRHLLRKPAAPQTSNHLFLLPYGSAGFPAAEPVRSLKKQLPELPLRLRSHWQRATG
jgi:hypothetical protein